MINSDFSGIAICACTGCGRTPDIVQLLPLSAYSKSWACLECVLKHGLEKLDGEADRQFSECVGKKKLMAPCSRGCGQFVYLDKNYRDWCDDCERERINLL